MAYTRQRMKNPRPSNNKTNTRPPRHISIDTRGIATRLLVAERDESNPQIDGFFGYLHDGDTNDSEDHGDA